MKKVFVVILILIGIALLLYIAFMFIGGLFLGGAFRPTIDFERMEEIFEEDHELLTIVTDYFISSEHTSIYIHSMMESGQFSFHGHRIEIEDVEVVAAIDTLMRRGYSVIIRRGDTILFQRWSNLRAGRGIAFSIDGREPRFTRVEPLPVPGWYYYEENYRAWQQGARP